MYKVPQSADPNNFRVTQLSAQLHSVDLCIETPVIFLEENRFFLVEAVYDRGMFFGQFNILLKAYTGNTPISMIIPYLVYDVPSSYYFSVPILPYNAPVIF